MAKKKRYHQTKMDRNHESRGMRKHLHHVAAGHRHESEGMHRALMAGDQYAGMDDRRRMEKQDGGMIHEDHHAMANMPQNVTMRPWPRGGYYLPEDLNDTITGIDHQLDLDGGAIRSNFMPKKY